MLRDNTGGAIPLTEVDPLIAQRARKALSRIEAATIPQYLHFSELPQDVVIPKAAIPLIAQILEAMSKGENVRLMAESRELTPQQAANMLGVSRPMLMHIVKQNIIPYRRVGSHYRLALQDVLAYQAEQERRERILQLLVTEAQELDMGY